MLGATDDVNKFPETVASGSGKYLRFQGLLVARVGEFPIPVSRRARAIRNFGCGQVAKRRSRIDSPDNLRQTAEHGNFGRRHGLLTNTPRSLMIRNGRPAQSDGSGTEAGVAWNSSGVRASENIA